MDTGLTGGSAATGAKASGFWLRAQDPPLEDCKSPHPAHLPPPRPCPQQLGIFLNPILASPCFRPPVGPCTQAEVHSHYRAPSLGAGPCLHTVHAVGSFLQLLISVLLICKLPPAPRPPAWSSLGPGDSNVLPPAPSGQPPLTLLASELQWKRGTTSPADVDSRLQGLCNRCSASF